MTPVWRTEPNQFVIFVRRQSVQMSKVDSDMPSCKTAVVQGVRSSRNILAADGFIGRDITIRFSMLFSFQMMKWTRGRGTLPLLFFLIMNNSRVCSSGPIIGNRKKYRRIIVQ